MPLNRFSVVLYCISAVLIFFGVLFLLAAVFAPVRAVAGVAFVVVGLFLIYQGRRREKAIIEIKWTPPEGLTQVELGCPYCSAPLNLPDMPVELVRCKYCGKVIQLVEG